MLFGYLVVRRLLILVRVLGRLPDGVSRVFAAMLNAGTRPFRVINYVGSLGGARLLGPRTLGAAVRSHRQQPRGELARIQRRRVGARDALRAFLRAGVMEQGTVRRPVTGPPQGG
jgi:hypothetical protein